MRHGQAGMGWVDNTRELTSKGEMQARDTAEFLNSIGINVVDTMITSSYIRAKQTANIVEESISSYDRLEEDMLAPDGNAELFAEYLTAIGLCNKRVMLVSHLPTVDILCQVLGVSECVSFTPATCVVLEYTGNTDKPYKLVNKYSPN